MIARDFARLGLLYLRGGVWDGDRILSDGWVDYGRSPTDISSEYGASLWLGRHGPATYSAIGFLGQHIVMIPEEDLVVVVLSNNLDAGLSESFADEVIDLFRGQ